MMEKPPPSKPRFLPFQVPVARGGLSTLAEMLNRMANGGYRPARLWLHEGSFLVIFELESPPKATPAAAAFSFSIGDEEF